MKMEIKMKKLRIIVLYVHIFSLAMGARVRGTKKKHTSEKEKETCFGYMKTLLQRNIDGKFDFANDGYKYIYKKTYLHDNGVDKCTKNTAGPLLLSAAQSRFFSF